MDEVSLSTQSSEETDAAIKSVNNICNDENRLKMEKEQLIRNRSSNYFARLVTFLQKKMSFPTYWDSWDKGDP